MGFVLYNGAPGTTWTNTTGRAAYQLIVAWINSCGACCQYDHAISHGWAIPLHYNCRCRQVLILPGAESEPFIDFRAEVDALPEEERSKVCGASCYRLIQAGKVDWSDVVTEGRVRTLREVVSLKQIDVKTMTDLGIKKAIAEDAYSHVNTAAHTLADEARRRLTQRLAQKGVTVTQARQMVAERLAARVVITGPGGPSAPPIQFTPPPSPPPRPPSTPLPTPAPRTPSLTPADIASLFGLKLKTAKTPKAPSFPAKTKLGTLTDVKALGGASGAQATLVRDADGNLWVRKLGRVNPGQLQEEAHADAIYKAAGVGVARSKIYLDPLGMPIKLSEYHEGKTLSELLGSDPAAAEKAMKEARKGFVVDALLGNWDAVGLGHDNLLVTPDGKVLRIDNGGALRYRAQGALKGLGWGPRVGELDSLRDSSINPAAAKVFGSLTDKEIVAQIKALAKKEAAILKAAPPEVRPMLQQRLDHLKQWAADHSNAAAPAKKSKGGAWAPAPEASFTKVAGDFDAWGKPQYKPWAKTLADDEGKALRSYTGSGYSWMQPILWRGDYSNADNWGVDRATADAQIRNLRTALDRSTVPEAVQVYRGVDDGMRILGLTPATAVQGREVNVKGFMSTSVDRNSAFSKDTVLTIRIPAGTRGAAYVNAAGKHSSHPSEHELLLNDGAGRFRVVSYERKNGKDRLVLEMVPRP